MGRLTARVDTLLHAVQCPGCGATVSPNQAQDATAGSLPAGGRRMSFAWRPTSRAVCPDCGFPIERFLRRQRWIRLFLAGVVLLTLGGAVFMLGWIRGSPGGWTYWMVWVAGGLGGSALIVGLLGLTIGGRTRAGGRD